MERGSGQALKGDLIFPSFTVIYDVRRSISPTRRAHAQTFRARWLNLNYLSRIDHFQTDVLVFTCEKTVSIRTNHFLV